MANSKINLELQIGVFSEALIECEVEYSLDNTGDLVIDDFYAYYIEVDTHGHETYERVPYWMHKMIAIELEDIKYDLLDI